MYTYSELMAEFRRAEDWRYDPWGSAMSVLFDLCDRLYHRDGETPAEWHYQPGISGPALEPDSYWFEIFRDTSSAVLITFGHTLHRYIERLRMAGRDY